MLSKIMLKAQDFFSEHGFQQIKLWKWRSLKINKFKEKKIQFNSIKQLMRLKNG